MFTVVLKRFLVQGSKKKRKYSFLKWVKAGNWKVLFRLMAKTHIRNINKSLVLLITMTYSEVREF